MGRRLILDTNVLISYERGTIDRSRLADDELAIAAVTVAEYRVGIELASTAERAAQRSRALAVFMDIVEVLDYTTTTAVHHAALIAHTKSTGVPRGQHDLIIAAHALQTGRSVVSRDAKARFGDLPGVMALEVK
ncbi:PIN domain-containing protein [Nocardiopsis protaetiae]|uniref:PIN domain-containing protein n=1 Tax=Nocardiopsis protaetiae TaxID=3382270 RepID=UPI00387B4034